MRSEDWTRFEAVAFSIDLAHPSAGSGPFGKARPQPRDRTRSVGIATDAATLEPRDIQLSWSLRWTGGFFFDLFQRLEDMRIGTKASQDLDERAERAARCVEDAIETFGIVPAVAEGSIASDIRPVGPGPGVGNTRHSVERRPCAETT